MSRTVEGRFEKIFAFKDLESPKQVGFRGTRIAIYKVAVQKAAQQPGSRGRCRWLFEEATEKIEATGAGVKGAMPIPVARFVYESFQTSFTAS
ncbi:MAG: hypothetical protein AB1631_25125 [Acidobacteriota bacterium]